MPRLQRISAVRNWTERHAHRSLKLAEDDDGRIWLRLDDLRQWMPGLPQDAALAQKHPGQVRLADASTRPYLEASAFAWLTRKSTNDVSRRNFFVKTNVHKHSHHIFILTVRLSCFVRTGSTVFKTRTV